MIEACRFTMESLLLSLECDNNNDPSWTILWKLLSTPLLLLLDDDDCVTVGMTHEPVEMSPSLLRLPIMLICGCCWSCCCCCCIWPACVIMKFLLKGCCCCCWAIFIACPASDKGCALKLDKWFATEDVDPYCGCCGGCWVCIITIITVCGSPLLNWTPLAPSWTLNCKESSVCDGIWCDREDDDVEGDIL